ncbi:protein-export chaperone SecB [Streptococcus caviae]|uniref:protein-export chaperone SecB n=1 Tax=Streptococcus sp. 'caviae' TaxID=1915004 RepID=UPI00094BA377|nr:protein-export chaperone SecB [Streptococcus sp. 'caviae']OLN83032.1 preprotein translocase subunit SecB [Streptococcus sp. 'caviae']
MSSLRFENYFLRELSYKKNDQFNHKKTKTIDLTPELLANILVDKKENKGVVNLKTVQGSLDNENSAFEVVVDIVGIFHFKNDPSEYDIKFEEFLKENALAILWSYIRPMVSDLITRGNEFPNFILPVINVRKILEENDSIKIEYISE